MSIGLVWLALFVLVPLICLYVLSVNAAPVFLALCLGYVLYSFDSHNAQSVISNLSKHQPSTLHLKPETFVIDLLLLLGPAVLILIFQLKSVSGSRKMLNILPSIFCGLFIGLIVVPILPASINTEIAKTSAWAKLVHFEALVVGAGALLAIVFFWLTHSSSGKKHHHKRKL